MFRAKKNLYPHFAWEGAHPPPPPSPCSCGATASATRLLQPCIDNVISLPLLIFMVFMWGVIQLSVLLYSLFHLDWWHDKKMCTHYPTSSFVVILYLHYNSFLRNWKKGTGSLPLLDVLEMCISS